MSEIRYRDRNGSGADDGLRRTATSRMRPARVARGGRGPGLRASRPLAPVRAPSDQDGFTLVELLVVVLVLATLVGIAVPTFAQQRESAWDAAVTSELRTAMIALESYRSQNAGYSADVLAPEPGTAAAGWGYEPSSIVQLRHAVTLDSYCLIAWYEPESTGASTEPPVPSLADAADASGQLWGVRSSGSVARVESDFCGS